MKEDKKDPTFSISYKILTNYVVPIDVPFQLSVPLHGKCIKI